MASGYHDDTAVSNQATDGNYGADDKHSEVSDLSLKLTIHNNDVTKSELEDRTMNEMQKSKINEEHLATAYLKHRDVTSGDKMCVEQSESSQKAEFLGMPRGKPITLLLLGKTGKGKSSTGNTILSESKEDFPMERFVESNCSSSSETKDVTEKKNTVRERQITVVDTPGTCDTKLSHRQVIWRIAKAVALHPEGYHAFVVVMKCGDKMTEEERLSMTLLELLFGENMYQYAVFVFTDGRSFMKNQAKRRRKNEKDEKFEDSILSDRGSGNIDAVGPYIHKCKGGAVLFENLEEDYMKRWEMTNELIRRVDRMQKATLQEGYQSKYDDHMFTEARRLRLEKGDTFPVAGLADRLTDYAEIFLETYCKPFYASLQENFTGQ